MLAFYRANMAPTGPRVRAGADDTISGDAANAADEINTFWCNSHLSFQNDFTTISKTKFICNTAKFKCKTTQIIGKATKSICKQRDLNGKQRNLYVNQQILLVKPET